MYEDKDNDGKFPDESPVEVRARPGTAFKHTLWDSHVTSGRLGR